MKKLILLVLSTVCLASCSLKETISNVFSPSKENNYDDVSVTPITEDTSSTSYDKEVEEENVETPTEYTATNATTISASGDYYFEGTVNPINITKKDLVVYLFFNGVTVTSDAGIALASEKQIELHIVLQNGSTNTITNDFLDKNAVHIKGDIHISGNGILNIESKQKNGLKASKDIYVSGENVTLNVTGANHGISARSITVNKSTINVTAKGKDGIQLECDSDVAAYTTEQGFAHFVDAKITTDTYGDGIQAATYIYVSGGNMELTTHGDFIAYSKDLVTGENAEYKTDDFKFVKSGSTYKRVAKDEIRTLSSSYYAFVQSAKGLKAGTIEDSNGNDITTGDYEISVAHIANIKINSYDDCIHTNYGKVSLDSCNLELDTMDDGVHADYDLAINNASIKITSSYEGLEGANVTISGEKTNIISYSDDDGINAASDLVSQTNITINAGYLQIFALGDGVDANTALYFKGGTTIVEGPGRGNGSLDSDKIYFQGGIVFACSTSGMTEQMTATQNTFIYQGTTMKDKALISITDSSNKTLFSYTLTQSCNQLIFSHSDLQIGSSYNIMSDSSKITTISMTDSLTKVGVSGGGQSGGGGQGWPR